MRFFKKIAAAFLGALALWMDNNGDFFGAYELDSLQAQRRGEVVVPTLE